jgi:SAM-dependent methyltransferase
VAIAAAAAAVRRSHVAPHRHQAHGGILISSAGFYDLVSRLVLRSLFTGIADDVALIAPDRARVLEVGCGPGHLAIKLAQRGFDVTGIDLDPAMIRRALVNAERLDRSNPTSPEFQIGDVADLPFPDASFDMVVSTLSMHHWADPTRGLAEIGRILRPGGRALIWDFRPNTRHTRLARPSEHIQGSQLQVIGGTPWPSPGRFNLLQRTELRAQPGTA